MEQKEQRRKPLPKNGISIILSDDCDEAPEHWMARLGSLRPLNTGSQSDTGRRHFGPHRCSPAVVFRNGAGAKYHTMQRIAGGGAPSNTFKSFKHCLKLLQRQQCLIFSRCVFNYLELKRAKALLKNLPARTGLQGPSKMPRFIWNTWPTSISVRW